MIHYRTEAGGGPLLITVNSNARAKAGRRTSRPTAGTAGGADRIGRIPAIHHATIRHEAPSTTRPRSTAPNSAASPRRSHQAAAAAATMWAIVMPDDVPSSDGDPDTPDIPGISSIPGMETGTDDGTDDIAAEDAVAAA
ncbi:hypothetical protein Caci_1124 [Catenulispora acidiphila DSM 44928]|uniref:Uncharacterized protein n=1 Tax=Catenulispora acidiphila (strain DSM 44928 / JCM 14897 / NBRC 102108 / NRRL B-24433 / ID139908) TaxID=479433 RepID=C7Q5V3_CATAD|nr:hypothetical protein Caci_1124 [Catenulispora acidiphila DSM 44928]